MVATYVEETTARFPSITMLIARIHRDNTASARIARKAGFQKTGVDDEDPNIEVYRIRLDGKLVENVGEVQRINTCQQGRRRVGGRLLGEYRITQSSILERSVEEGEIG